MDNLSQLQKSKYAQAESKNLGMHWFIFTINFRMIFRIFAYFFCLFSAANTGIDFDSLILLGIVCIFFSGITVCTRFFLSYFRRKSPVFYFLTMCGLPIAFTVLLAMLTLDTPAYSASLSAFSISIASLIYLPAEISYLRKRSHLFDATSAKKTKTTKCSPAPKSSLSEPSISKASLPTHPEVSPTDDTPTRSIEKKGGSMMKKRVLYILWAIVTIAAILGCVGLGGAYYYEVNYSQSNDLLRQQVEARNRVIDQALGLNLNDPLALSEIPSGAKKAYDDYYHFTYYRALLNKHREELEKLSVPLYTPDGHYFGTVCYAAYTAIKNNSLDSYTPLHDEELQILHSYMNYITLDPGMSLARY